MENENFGIKRSCVCVLETSINETDDLFLLCMGGEIVKVDDFQAALTQKKVTQRIHMPVMLKILSILTKYPGNGKIGIQARAYPDLSLLTIGFMDLPGTWDPVLDFHFSEIYSTPTGQILEEIKDAFGAF